MTALTVSTGDQPDGPDPSDLRQQMLACLVQNGDKDEALMVEESGLEVQVAKGVDGGVTTLYVTLRCRLGLVRQLESLEEGGTNPAARARIYHALRRSASARYRHLVFEARVGMNGEGKMQNGKCRMENEGAREAGSGDASGTDRGSELPTSNIQCGAKGKVSEKAPTEATTKPPVKAPTKAAGKVPAVSGGAKDEGARQWIRLGRLEHTPDFAQVRFTHKGKPYEFDLREHRKAMLLLQLMEKREAYSVATALHFLEEIEPHVLKEGNYAKSSDPKLPQYFNDQTGELQLLRKLFIQVVRGTGRYYFDRDH